MTDPSRPLLVPYCRQSLARPGETRETSLSLAAQEEAIRAWGERNGYRVERAVLDHDLRGDDASRPGLAELTERAITGVTIAVHKWDRLARDLVLQETIVQALERRGIEVVSISEPSNRLTRQIIGAVAEDYKRSLSERLSSIRAAQARRGDYIGSQPPYGYRRAGWREVRGENGGVELRPHGALVPDEPLEGDPPGTVREAPLAREIAARVDGGEPMHAIARDLNRRGLRTRHGKAWELTTIRRLVSNVGLAGDVSHRGEVVCRDAHPALVERAVWERIQSRLQRQAIVRRDDRPSPASSWLEGLALHECGRRLYLIPIRVNHRAKDSLYPQFSCRTAYFAETCGIGRRHVSAPMLERAVRECLAADLASVVSVRDAIARAQAAAGGSETVRRRTALFDRRELLVRRRARARELWLSGLDPLEAWEAEQAAFTRDAAALDRELAELPAPPDPARYRDYAQTLRGFAGEIRAAPDDVARRILDAVGVAVLGPAGVTIRYHPAIAHFIPAPATVAPRRVFSVA